MKTIIKEVEGEGLISFLGQRVLILCAGYFYEGELVGVNETCVKLKDAGIVYETGSWADSNYLDLQKLHVETWYVAIGMIESFGRSKNA
jgi:hypothetical protein